MLITPKKIAFNCRHCNGSGRVNLYTYQTGNIIGCCLTDCGWCGGTGIKQKLETLPLSTAIQEAIKQLNEGNQ